MRRTFWVLIFVCFLAGVLPGLSAEKAAAAAVESQPRYLYVWAGHDGRTQSDALLVVDIDPSSATYSKVIYTVPVGSVGNEPHHIGLSSDGSTVVAGGLLSGRVFFFDLNADAARPQLVKIFNSQAVGLGVADEVKPLPGRGVLVSMMGDHHAASPGGMVLFDDKGELVARGDLAPPDSDINVHDFDTNPDANLLITTDFLIPHTLIEGAPRVRDTVRIWDLNSMQIRHTLQVGQGPWITKFLPGTQKALVSCFLDGTLWLVDASSNPPAARQVLDFDAEANNSYPSIMEISPDGRWLFEALYGMNKVVQYDVSDPTRPRLVSEVVTGQGPHYIRLSQDGTQLFVSNYFIEAGKTVLKGDNHVKLIHVERGRMRLDSTFDVDLNGAGAYTPTALAPQGAMRPHGLVLR
jgi:selenium-binding protein 1